MNRIYAIESGKLVIRDTDTNSVLWSGDFDGYPVLKILPLQQAENGCLVILDWSGSKQPTFENLLLVSADGTVAWRVPLPGSNDCYVDVRSTSEGVAATSWNGWQVIVDPWNKTLRTVAFAK